MRGQPAHTRQVEASASTSSSNGNAAPSGSGFLTIAASYFRSGMLSDRRVGKGFTMRCFVIVLSLRNLGNFAVVMTSDGKQGKPAVRQMARS